MSLVNTADVLLQRDVAAVDRAHPSAFSIARIVLVAALIGAPCAFGAVDPWAWMGVGLIACSALLLWAVGTVQQKALKLIWSSLYIPLVAVFLLGLIQYYARLTLDKAETRRALVMLALDLTLFFATVQLFGEANTRTRRGFGLAVMIFAGLLSLFALLQFASGTQLMYWKFDTGGYNFFGPYGNPDHYAGLMEMLIPVAVCYIAEQRRRHSFVALLPLVLMAAVAVASLLLSGSRGGLLALSTEIVIASAILMRVAGSEQRWGFAALVGGAVLTAVLLFSWVDPGWVAQRLGSIFDIPRQTWVDATDFRKRLALDSLRMLRDHPVLGVGLGNFEIAYPPYQSFPSDFTIDYAHDDYVEAAAETGLVGAALIVSAVTLFFRLAFHNASRHLESGHGWIQLGAALGCCGLLAHSFVDFNLHVPANAAWFAVLAGFALSEAEKRRDRHRWRRVPHGQP